MDNIKYIKSYVQSNDKNIFTTIQNTVNAIIKAYKNSKKVMTSENCYSASGAEAEKLQYDLYYLKHRNVLWEIGILIKAVFLALGGRHG